MPGPATRVLVDGLRNAALPATQPAKRLRYTSAALLGGVCARRQVANVLGEIERQLAQRGPAGEAASVLAPPDVLVGWGAPGRER